MFRLQISCVLILCFLMLIALIDRKYEKRTQKLFFAILIVSVFALFFEMAAVYTVRNIEAVAPVLYKTIHRSYLTLVLTFFYLLYIYKAAFLEEEVGFTTKSWAFINIAQVILYLGIFILPLGYETWEGGEYTYGPGMWIVYVGAAFYLFMVFSGYCEYTKKIEKEKILPLIFGVGFGMVACFYYMCVPSSELSGVGILIINIGTYISVKNCKSLTWQEGSMPELSHKETGDEKDVVFKAPGARVLVVDDSLMNRKVIVNLLGKTEMQIDEAAGGAECLQLVKERHYDLIYMDHLMPDMDGVETLATLKKQKLCDNTEVIAMTANSDNMSESEYRKCGFTALLPKPVSPQQLNKVSYRLLDKKLVSFCEYVEGDMSKLSNDSSTAESGKENGDTNLDDMPLVDGLDYNYAALHFPDRDSFLDMVRFLTSVMLYDEEELKTYYDALDTSAGCSDFRTKVHSMKNSAMTIGIVPLAGLAKTLEDAAGDGDTDTVRALMPIFLSKWEKYYMLLGQKFAESTGEKKVADLSSEEVKDIFRSLKRAAEEMDIDEMDRIMNRVDEYCFPEEFDEDISKIRMAVINFEVEFLVGDGLAKFIDG